MRDKPQLIIRSANSQERDQGESQTPFRFIQSTGATSFRPIFLTTHCRVATVPGVTEILFDVLEGSVSSSHSNILLAIFWAAWYMPFGFKG
jgi:hypothetical protein